MADDWALGFALLDRSGVPFPSTVALTERAAMVNALVSIWSHPVYATDGDAKIEADFRRLCPAGFKISPVSVERVIVQDCNDGLSA